MRPLHVLACLALATPAAAPLAAQAPGGGPAITLGVVHRIHSDVLAEDRPYLVYRPDGPRGPIPMIVLLDGDAHFHHTTGIVRFLADQGRMPAALVVAVPNTTDRTRDLTPAVLDSAAIRAQFPSAGGADRMLAFLADELIPEVEGMYGTSPFRVLVGHSFGGLFAAHAMLTRPDVFQGYVAISPSLWWDGGRLADSLVARAAAPGDQPWLYATMGGLEPPVQLDPFARAAEAPARAEWQFVTLAQDDHGSTPHKSTYDGLEAIFRPLRLPGDSLIALGIAGLDRRYAALEARYGLYHGTPEEVLNALGYALLAEGRARAPEGVAAFRENARRFPTSGNTYDSLADGMLALDRREAALACYANAVRVGLAHPEVGERIQGRVLAPLSHGRMAALARDLGRPVWAPDAIPGTVEGDCLGAAAR